jgi:hypothetical protein
LAYVFASFVSHLQGANVLRRWLPAQNGRLKYLQQLQKNALAERPPLSPVAESAPMAVDTQEQDADRNRASLLVLPEVKQVVLH